jgi:hypothetical protein
MSMLKLHEQIVEFLIVDAPDVFFDNNCKYKSNLKSMVTNLPYPHWQQISLIFDTSEAKQALNDIDNSNSELDPLTLLLLCCTSYIQTSDLLLSRRCMGLLYAFLLRCKESRLSNHILNMNNVSTRTQLKEVSLSLFADQLLDHENSVQIPLIATPLFLIGRLCKDGNLIEASNYVWASNALPDNLYTLDSAVKVMKTIFRDKVPFPYKELHECKDGSSIGWSQWKELSQSVINSIGKAY